MTRSPWGMALLVLAAASGSQVVAGEIPGIPSQAPPFLQRDLEINLSNDFLGRGGATDDFRTQQIILMARFSDNWLALIDHSILTYSSTNQPGRLDQLSASLGYELVKSVADDHATRLTVGGGLRSNGDFAGARMQNGFHRLVGSDVETMPYVATDERHVTAWIDAETYRTIGDREWREWQPGYWLRGNALVTSDGQLDSALGAYAVASKGAIDVWFGVRRDWRSGYENDPVQVATAAAESDLGLVLGARFGALLLETVQQPNGEASYGQLKFVSSGKRPFPQPHDWPRIAFGLGFTLPDVHLQLSGRMRSHFFLAENSPWRQSLMLETLFGEPQYGDNTAVFVNSRQVTLGIEMERVLSPELPWISFYGSLAGGYRSEKLLGDNVLATEESERVGRAVVGGGSGLRFNAAALGRDWNYRLQIGLSAWLPLSDAHVDFAGNALRVQKPALEFLLGMTFEHW